MRPKKLPRRLGDRHTKSTAKKSPAKTSKAKAPPRAKTAAPVEEGKGRRADEIVKFLTGAPKDGSKGRAHFDALKKAASVADYLAEFPRKRAQDRVTVGLQLQALRLHPGRQALNCTQGSGRKAWALVVPGLHPVRRWRSRPRSTTRLETDVTEGYVQMTAERLRGPAQRVADELKRLCG